MAVKSSGQLAMTEIVAEFGGDAPHAMSEYYGGGSLVPQGANPNVSTSGQNKFSNFYNSVAATVLNILSNTTNYNIKTAVQAAGGDLNTPVILTIASGVTVSSTSSTEPAMKTDTGWGAGVTINITNNGSIVGSAGADTSANPSSGGGSGGSAQGGFGSNGNGGSGSAGQAGSGSADSANNGSPAFTHSQPGSNLSVIFDTAGTRTGGAAGTKTIQGNGGGGGAGRGLKNFSPKSFWYYPGAGGGGGAAFGSAGSGGGPASGPGPNGSAGGATSGGSGGSPFTPTAGGGGGTTARGGSGGNLGSAGSSGGPGGNFGSNGSGGSAGADANVNGTAGSALAGNTAQIS